LKRKILVVDDEPEILALLGEYLTKKGFQVTKCSGGEEALATVKSGRTFDIILLDGRMPGIDGIAVLEEFENMKFNIPVIFLTGDIDWEAKHCDVKVDSFINKPVDLHKLLDKINKILKVR